MNGRTALLALVALVVLGWSIPTASGAERRSDLPQVPERVLGSLDCGSKLVGGYIPLWDAEAVGEVDRESAAWKVLEVAQPRLPEGRLVADGENPDRLLWLSQERARAVFSLFTLPNGGWAVDSALWCHGG